MTGNNGGVDIEAETDALYAVAPQDFIAARTEAVARAKDTGDKSAAAELGKLPKPTVAAWLLNLLVREQPDQVRQFVSLGTSLREAAESLDGDELRQLNRQRRQIVLALVQQAVAIGRSHGQRASSSVEDEVRETLEASLADPDVGETVLGGRLAKSVQYAGFGGVGGGAGSSGVVRRPTAPTPVRTTTAAQPAPVPDLTAMRRARAQQALDDAERAVRRAERERDAEAGRWRAAEARRDELDAKVTRMRAELAEVEQQLDVAQATLAERAKDLERADAALARTTVDRSKAADELARLTSAGPAEPDA